MPEGRPFGGEDWWPGDAADDPLTAPDPEAPEAQVTEPAPQAATSVQETPAPTAPEASPAAEATATDEPQGEQPETPEQTPETPPQYAGRFATVEALEKGWHDSDRFAREAAARANEAERQLQAARAEMAQVLPYLQQQQSRIDPAALERLGLDPDAGPVLQQLLDAEVARRVAPVEQRYADERAQQAAQLEAAARQSAIDTFKQAHPEAAAQEDQMVQILHELQVVDPQGFGPKDPAWYEIAYEAAQRPALARVLRADPALSETDDGMEIARVNAGLLEARAAAAAPGQPSPAPGSTAPPADAGLLQGSSNAPAPGQAPKADAIDEILQEDRASRRSIFTRSG